MTIEKEFLGDIYSQDEEDVEDWGSDEDAEPGTDEDLPEDEPEGEEGPGDEEDVEI